MYRAASVNAGLLRAAAAQLPPGVTLEIVVPHLPMYDGDVEAKGVPPAVKAFCAQARPLFLRSRKRQWERPRHCLR